MCHVVLCPQLGTGPPNEARRLQPHHRHHCRRPHRQGSPFQLSRARVLFCREQSLVRIDTSIQLDLSRQIDASFGVALIDNRHVEQVARLLGFLCACC